MATFTTINPYTLKAIGTFPFHTVTQAQATLKLLQQGHATQAKLPAFQRANILHTLAQLIQQHKEEMAQLITLEIGKSISDSRVEMDRVVNTFIASAEEARRVDNATVASSDTFAPAQNRLIITQNKPLGTILCVTPFNFPVNLAAHKIGPAFAAGNTILLKPHPHGYLSTLKLVEIAHQAGIPQDCIQFIMLENQDLQEIAASNLVHCVNLTGSVAAGQALAKAAGPKKLLFELGGNDPLIVFPDCKQLENAAKQAVIGRFYINGQRCTAPKRVLAHKDIYPQFRDLVVEMTKKLRVGDPTLNDTEVGPVISTRAADAVWNRLQDAISRGATVLCGNKREENIIWPTVIENVPDDCDLVADETFGPIMPLRSFSTMDEVVSFVNSTPYGLQGGVFTDSLSTARELFEKLDVGTLAVNAGPQFRVETSPFGGVKHSGLGREGISYAMKEMTYIKTLVL